MLLFSNMKWNQTGSRLFRYGLFFCVATNCLLCCVYENAIAQQNTRQPNTRPIPNQTANRAIPPNQTANRVVVPNQTASQTENQATPPARLVAKPEPMKSVPDFRAIYSTSFSSPTITDRLDRKNLPMLYHFSYDQLYHNDTYHNDIVGSPSLSMGLTSGMSMAPTPGMTMAPTPGMSMAPTPYMTMAPTPGMSMAPTPPSRNNYDINDLDARLSVLREKTEASNRIIVPATTPQVVSVPQTTTSTRRISGNQGVVALDDF